MAKNISRDDFLKLAGLGLGTSMMGFNIGVGPKLPISPYGIPRDIKSRWTSPENRQGTKGGAAKENKGAKGHAFDKIETGETYVLLDVDEPGIVNKIRMTIKDRSPVMLRSLRI